MPDNSWKAVFDKITNQQGYIHAIINLVFHSDRKINLWYSHNREHNVTYYLFCLYTTGF